MKILCTAAGAAWLLLAPLSAFDAAWAEDLRVDFVPHLIDDQSGVGTQVVAIDINGDGLPDTVVGNKRGTFVHLQQKKSVSGAK